MEKMTKNNHTTENIVQNGIFKTIKPISWPEDLTVLNLRNMNISMTMLEETTLPKNLVCFSLSCNGLESVPQTVIKLEKLKYLDLSKNRIQLFDDIPSFCHSIEKLDLSENHLKAPPYWIWSEKPKHLTHLNINNNFKLMSLVDKKYYEFLSQCSTLLTHIVIYGCNLGTYLEFFATLKSAKKLVIGSESTYSCNLNFIEHIPCKGLEHCCDVETLDLTNTKLYAVEPNIEIYKNLIEINLSNNNLRGLPKEFCNLVKLKKCVLSFNMILYLPDEFSSLIDLTELYLNDNELCMWPENMKSCKHLTILDIYANKLFEPPEIVETVKSLDFAQNFFEEPDTDEYKEKKHAFRSKLTKSARLDGMQIEVEVPPSIHSPDTTDDEMFSNVTTNSDIEERRPHLAPSSDEDWDSDSYWVPDNNRVWRPTRTWESFVIKKLGDGNFCPIDLHTIPIAEQVKMYKRCNPTVQYESDGQFDDLTDDDS